MLTASCKKLQLYLLAEALVKKLFNNTVSKEAAGKDINVCNVVFNRVMEGYMALRNDENSRYVRWILHLVIDNDGTGNRLHIYFRGYGIKPLVNSLKVSDLVLVRVSQQDTVQQQ